MSLPQINNNFHSQSNKASVSKKITGLKLHQEKPESSASTKIGFSREQASVQMQAQVTQAQGEGDEEGGPYYYPHYHHHGHRDRPYRPQPAGAKTMTTMKIDNSVAADDDFFAEIGIQIAPRQQSNSSY